MDGLPHNPPPGTPHVADAVRWRPRAPAVLQRLKDNAAVRLHLGALLRSPLGPAIVRPWSDWVFLRLLTGGMLPTARLWATAEATGFDPGHLVAAHPGISDRIAPADLRAALAGLTRLQARALATEREAQAAIAGSSKADRVAATDQSRRVAAYEYLAARASLFKAARSVAPVDFAIPDDRAVADWLKPWGETADALFAAPDTPPVLHETPPIKTPGGPMRILMGPSPAPWIDEPLIARVHEPEGLRDPPTYIHCHGIGIDGDQMSEGADEILSLVARGVRVVRLVAPWHGRRRPLGSWSGERFLATAPLGAIQFFAAVVREYATLVGWARATSRGPVAIGGISLGALSAQLAAVRAHAWPAALRPDALLLIATGGPLDAIAYEGSLTRRLGLDRALSTSGWSQARLQPLARLTDPQVAPAVDPAKIVMVLGRKDDVTPYHGGKALATRWQVPAGNLFVNWQGHFTVELGLIPDARPLARMAAILHGGG